MRYEPQGLDRYAKFDMADVRTRQRRHEHTPDWRGAYLWCLRYNDEESAELIRLRNDHDYRERVEEEARQSFVSAPLKSCREVASEEQEVRVA